MSQVEFSSRRKLPLALSVRISFILVLAAVLPLLITVFVSELGTARPALIDQANQTMKTDADTRIQLVNTYLKERMLDVGTISLVPTVQGLMALPPATVATTLARPASNPAALTNIQGAGYGLAAGQFRDKSHYINWQFFYPDGTPLPFIAPQNAQPHHYGQYLVPLGEVAAIADDKTGVPFASPVYYDSTLKKAFLDIYSPIYKGYQGQGNPSSFPLLGFARASLNLDYIWDVLQNDKGINSSGSAFILDNNGIRIADTDRNSPDLFTSVAKLDSNTVQPLAKAENWYNQNGQLPPVHADPTLSDVVQGKNTASNFGLKLNGTDYQAAVATTTGIDKTSPVNWTYVVTSPSSAVTQVADQQLSITIIVAIVVALLAAVIGWWLAQRISRPIMRSVEQLHESSEALNVLAKKQQSASSEQLWVVDSVQVGLQSVQYYTDATRIAARKLGDLGMDLERSWHRQNIETVRQGLQQVISAANYIEKATNYQGDSGQKLSTAIKVTTQVNEQLADGAISATEAASQLEQVVNDLRGVVGK